MSNDGLKMLKCVGIIILELSKYEKPEIQKHNVFHFYTVPVSKPYHKDFMFPCENPLYLYTKNVGSYGIGWHVCPCEI